MSSLISLKLSPRSCMASQFLPGPTLLLESQALISRPKEFQGFPARARDLTQLQLQLQSRCRGDHISEMRSSYMRSTTPLSLLSLLNEKLQKLEVMYGSPYRFSNITSSSVGILCSIKHHGLPPPSIHTTCTYGDDYGCPWRTGWILKYTVCFRGLLTSLVDNKYQVRGFIKRVVSIRT